MLQYVLKSWHGNLPAQVIHAAIILCCMYRARFGRRHLTGISYKNCDSYLVMWVILPKHACMIRVAADLMIYGQVPPAVAI